MFTHPSRGTGRKIERAHGPILDVCATTSRRDSDAAYPGGVERVNAIGFNGYPEEPALHFARTGRAHRDTGSAPRRSIRQRRTARRAGEVARTAGCSPVAQPAMAIRIARRVSGSTHRLESGAASPPRLRHLALYDQCPAEALLLDGPAAELYGGAGHTFDWTLAAATRHRIIVAGGLDASNVARAIALAHPWGVDACSRIESEPGKKDIRKMTEFLQAALKANREAIRA